ncbi:Hsp33 family molecular chaperone HslO [Prochlorococcus marinus]|uniref:Hsp33 family molecular chaperone HslO n=1 Tax=Prochlorococcus marinus TaxID=1219 RepID=UPI0022B4AB7A|nr:Hsp33 family molecular chaperone HslO [Prochlorococcus marinus]
MKDNLIRATAANGSISLVAVLITQALNEAKRRHSLSFLTSALLGRAMSTGLLLASSMKVKQGRVTIKIQSDGPLKGLNVDAGCDGTVRGYVGNPKLELDLIKDSEGNHYFDFNSATGKGYLHVTRDIGQGQPFASTVELIQGGIGEDIASYLMHSEQIQSAVFVGEKILNSEIICSGALIAQVLPNAITNKLLINKLDDECKKINFFSEKLFQCRNNLQDIFKMTFPSLTKENILIKDKPKAISFKCRCSRTRSISALKLLGKEEIINILNEDKKSEIRCNYCNSIYLIEETELKAIIDQL